MQKKSEFPVVSFFSRVNMILEAAMSVGLSVGRSVRHIFEI